MEELQYQSEINEFLKTLVCWNFAQSPDFQNARAALLAIGNSSDEQLNSYIQLSVSQGVSVEQALKCAAVFFQIKSIE